MAQTQNAPPPNFEARLRARIHEMLEPHGEDNGIDRAFNSFVVALIVLNVAAVMLETVDALVAEHAMAFAVFEAFSITFFSLEYVLRWWSCVEDSRYAHPFRGRLRYALTPAALIDFAVLVPFYFGSLIGIDLRVLRVFRLFRVFMLLKLVRYARAVKLLSNVFLKHRETLFVTLSIGAMLLVFASSMMYYAENAAQPKAFPHIPGAMWWAVVTLTTVGYGDVYPITPVGKMLAGCIAVLGIGLFALPAGILASGISEELQEQRQAINDNIDELQEDLRELQASHCPHCRKSLLDPPDARAS